MPSPFSLVTQVMGGIPALYPHAHLQTVLQMRQARARRPSACG